jgi:DNA-binding NtrC family response regulator
MDTENLVSIVDDDESIRQAVEGLLRSAGLRVAAFASAEALFSSDCLPSIDCLILDLEMPGGVGGLQLQQRLTDAGHRIPTVILTAHGEPHARSRAQESGAVAFLTKPFDGDTLLAAVRSALAKPKLDTNCFPRGRETMNAAPCLVSNGHGANGTATASAENGRHAAADGVLDQLIGKAPAFESVVASLPTLAKSDGTVLITGETGTGKELVARALHELSARAARPFVAVNCGSLVDTLLEGELFGHERGAFTDAHARRQGLIAHAAGGTLFLDEAETLSPRAQVVLLRVLQERTFRAVGSSSEQRVDVRFIAATNAGLDRLVQSGQFRADLYYRLCVFSVTLPPLRQRREDILPLAAHFLSMHARNDGFVPRLSSAAMQALLTFEWPGNVRELQSAIVRAVHLAKDGVIEVGDLGLPGVRGHGSALLALPETTPGDYKIQKRQVLDAFERQYLVQLMTEHGGNVSRAALAAGKERRDLGKLLKRHGLDPRQFAQ